MFSQFSFLPKDKPSTPSPGLSPAPSTNQSPFSIPSDRLDDSDYENGLDDYSDTASQYQRSSSRALSTVSIPEEDEGENEVQPQIQVQAPLPNLSNRNSSPALGSSLPASRPGSSDRLRSPRSSSVSRNNMIGKENYRDTLAPSPVSIHSRASPSPSRLPKLNALSPLQTFSPLQPKSNTSDTASSLSSSQQKTGSLTRSLSRRESMIESAKRWSGGAYEGDNQGAGLFSRLTLVKAPPEKKEVAERRHIRSKSQSALSPFNAFASFDTTPATLARGPRRSFAASSFGGSPGPATTALPIGDASHAHQSDSLHRVRSRQDDKNSDNRKAFSPDEVFSLAQSLHSPVIRPDDGLKRRKSASSLTQRGYLGPDSPERPAAELEPVEYVQMDEDVLLPFVERSSEVQELLDHSSNAKLISLLRAAFPKDLARPNYRYISPEQWRWDELIQHLTQTERAEMDDYDWVYAARQAVRARSVALWEKLGVCLGCDEDLLNVGSEDDSPPSWGGLGLGEEGEYDPSGNHVVISGIESTEQEDAENQLRQEFGEIVEDEGDKAAAGMSALLGLGGMETIGEQEEEGHLKSKPTTAQKAGNKANIDPMSQSLEMSPPRNANFSSTRPASRSLTSSDPRLPEARPARKSFVGLSISTAPTHSPHSPDMGLYGSPASHQTHTADAPLPIYERGPGSPLFPTSFSNLSFEPNLGRSASVAVGGMGGGKNAVPLKEELRSWVRGGAGGYGSQGLGGIAGLRRKASGAGLSESAITFASESDWSGP